MAEDFNSLVEIKELNPKNFEFQNYMDKDTALIAMSQQDTVFEKDTDYIEYCVYDETKRKVFPIDNTITLSSYDILQGDVSLYPEKDLRSLGFDKNIYNILYNFYRRHLSSSPTQQYYIKEISSDRKEIRLDSNIISNGDIISSTNQFIEYREQKGYFVDFYLNFGNNKTVIANNIKLDTTLADDPTILIKLYEPLPAEFETKSELWVVEEISEPELYQVKFPVEILEEESLNFIKGPNFNINVKNEVGNASEEFTFESLVNTNLTSSVRQVNSILENKGIEININYENFDEFTYFSSAKTRLENFIYKVGLIESYNNSISASLGQITSNTISTSAFSASKANFDSKIDNITLNFDDYERFLYYNSGSSFSYPKTNTTPPYNLYSTGSTEVLEWLGSADPSSAYYGGLALSASNYDDDNINSLFYAIPEYLRDDPDNEKYKLFVDMVGQHYDNIWIYTKDITKKFNGDNRLEFGISKDLIDIAVKDFGVKLYSSNFDNQDLFTAFLGLTPSGSLFPFPEMTGSLYNLAGNLDIPTGFEYVDTKISSSNDPIPLNEISPRLYKRIYHNIPYLLKTKGTIAGLRALITSYGIPDTILRINEFGGKDRNNSQDWDLKQRVFNYAFDTEGTYIISSSFAPNTLFRNGATSPRTVQLRFKSRGIPPTNLHSQSLYEVDNGTSALVLEYTGSGLDSGSYSGSIPSEENKYGVLKFIPDKNNSEYSASLVLPFFDGDWWSVQTVIDTDNTASLHAANEINNNLGFTGSATVSGFDSNYYFASNKIAFPNEGDDFTIGGKTYKIFSGSYQEIRYYNSKISESKFFDYTMNPYSFEGNEINNAPNELIFRADLGTLLNTGSTTSVHPKITGSSQFTTSSFASDSNFYISSSNFVVNREIINQDQVVAGIKNRTTDKISTEALIVPEGKALSPIISIQQESFESSSYTTDPNYLEVAFSPQDQINDDINSQMGYFNIGEYIGDPRHISQSGTNYPNLDALRDAYFNKYISSYNLVDFVRLMKFFDNSLFKMIKDFTPAKMALSSGVIVKQHILERNRVRPAQVTSSIETLSGSIKPQVRNYSTGSGEMGNYEYTSGSAIYRFSGGTGGTFERFNGLEFSPSASVYSLSNIYGVTQSYSESKEGKLGQENITVFDQKEFYDGEFSGSEVTVTTQSLGPECIVYLKNPDKPIRFFPIFFSDGLTLSGNPNFTKGTVMGSDFLNRFNIPKPGFAWIYTRFNDVPNSANIQKDIVYYIKLNGIDADGNDVRDYIQGSNQVQFVFPEGIKTYVVDGVVLYSSHAKLTISQQSGDYLFASSSNGGSENWNLRAYGNYTSSAGTTPGLDVFSQNKFHALSTNQTQVIRFYNGGGDEFDPTIVGDPSNLFVTGSESFETTELFNNSTGFLMGSYTIPRTPNIPWVISCSIEYSASADQSPGIIEIETEGIYSSGSFYGAQSRTTSTRIFNSASVNSMMISDGSTNESTAQSQALTTPIYFSSSNTPITNGTQLYTDPWFDQPGGAANFAGVVVKYYRLGENHTFQVNSFGKVTNLNRFQSSGDPTPLTSSVSSSFDFILPGFANASNVDSTFFIPGIDQNAFGDTMYSDREIYSYNSNTTTSGLANGEIRFNNATISSATTIAIDFDNISGDPSGIVVQPNPTAVTKLRIYGNDPKNEINIDSTSVQTVGDGRVVYNTSGISVTGSFSDGDAMKILFNKNSQNQLIDRSPHPVIDIGGTASLDWRFDRYLIGEAAAEPAGTNTNSVTLSPQYGGGTIQQGFTVMRPLSGSLTSQEYSNPNDDFVKLSTNPTNDFSHFFRSGSDGAYAFNPKEFNDFQQNQVFNQDNYYPTLVFKYTIQVKSDAEYVNASTQYARSTAIEYSTNGGTSWSQIEATKDNSLASTSPVSHTLGPSGYTFNTALELSYLEDGNGDPVDEDILFRLVLGGTPDQQIQYKVLDFSVRLFFSLFDDDLTDEVAETEPYVPDDDAFIADNDGNPVNTNDQVTLDINLSTAVGTENILDLEAQQGISPSAFQLQVVPGAAAIAGYAEAIVQPKLKLTGSFATEKLVGIAPGIQFPITGSSLLNFSSSVYSPITASYNELYRVGQTTYDEYFYELDQVDHVTFEFVDPNFRSSSLDTTPYPSSSITVSGSVLGGQTQRVKIPVAGGTTPTIIEGTANVLQSTTGLTLHPTISDTGSMFFPLFSFSDRRAPDAAKFGASYKNVAPFTNRDFPKLFITNSIQEEGTGFRMTGSLRVHKGNLGAPNSLGPVIFSQPFTVATSESIERVSVSGSVGLPFTTFRYNDSFRMSVALDKNITSFLDITQYTMSLFPSESQFATITDDFSYYGVPDQPEGADYGVDVYGGSTVEVDSSYGKYSKPTLTEIILDSYYGGGVLPFAIMLDCQPLINNFNLQRDSTYLMDIDYNLAGEYTYLATGSILEGSSFITNIDAAGIQIGNIVRFNNNEFEESGGDTIVIDVNSYITGDVVTVNKNASSTITGAEFEFITPSFGSLRPINFNQIIQGIADKANIPDSNYTQESFTLPRYKGSKSTSQNINRWSPRDIGTYGELPNVEIRTAYFGYFNSLNNLYPLLNDAVNANLVYFVDQQGNALPPNVDGGFGSAIVEKAYSPDDTVTFSLLSSSIELEELQGETSILQVGKKPIPITYSQNGGRNFVTTMSFSGSGRLSLYDDPNSDQSFTTFGQVAEGTSSWQDTNNLPTPSTYTSGDPVFLTQKLNPTVVSSPFSDPSYSEFTSSYSSSGTDIGTIQFIDQHKTSNDELSNPQEISLDTSFHTSFLYEGYRKRKNDGDELKIQLQMLVNGVGVEFELEDLEMIVHKTSGKPINLGSILGAGKGSSKFELVVFIGDKVVKKGRRGKRRTYSTRSTKKLFNSTTKSYFMTIENPAYEAFIKKAGVYTHGTGDVQFRGDMTATEWKLSANSGGHIFKHGDKVEFVLKVAMLQSVSKNGNNVFYPTAYTGPINPTRIVIQGAKDHLLDNSNAAAAPFWVHTGSAGLAPGSQTVLDSKVLVMSSSIFNEAYGGSFTQNPIKYNPGQSEYFLSGTEPSGSTLGTPAPLLLQPGDEIRFQNNENYSYTIVDVTPPGQNVEANEKARLKIELDREVPASINKDFFLVRRFVDSPSSFILDQSFPTSINNTASIGSGVLFPEFPAENLEVSSSQIITELVSKGVIT